MKKFLACTLVFALLLASGCNESEETEKPFQIYAAASLSEVVNELAQAFSTATGRQVVINLGSSGMLARQINKGAQADIFISAHRDWLRAVVNERNYREGTLHMFATNSLVAAGSADLSAPPSKLEDLAESPGLTIAIGDPAHVPAGIYAKQALERASLWQIVEKQIIPALDVRSALTYAWRGDADIAIVYKTDLSLLPDISLLFEIPDQMHDPIQYGVLAPFGAQEEADDFIDLMLSEKGAEILRSHGFKPRASTGR